MSYYVIGTIYYVVRTSFYTVYREVSASNFSSLIIPPVYEVYRGYIVFAFSVCVLVCLCVNFFSVKDFSGTTRPRILKFGTKLGNDNLYCVTKNQPHIAYQALYLSIFLSL